MKNRVKWLTAAIALTILLSGCSGTSAGQVAAEEKDGLQGPYDVVRVVDGDTIIIDIDGQEERVRLIGVDTPESVHPDGEKNVAYGKVASEYTADMLEDQQVEVEYDVQERDRYGRILAYVYLDGTMFNKTLLTEGHAKLATYPPNVKYTEDFTELQEEARAEKKGVWAYDSLSQGSAEGDREEETSYIGNSSTKKYHRESCSAVLKMNEENKVIFQTGEEAETQGYEPCKRCNP
ncbi:thermonuclease family protein [Sinanaerobacter chloroacetimidivorans]|uniref:thermonuclease family protein n=1 Tax=Sinanaerobacter chloroacetimidivorans TaxID=2818044 RepID=UPI001D0526CA|nr:thermonuclease family protein [Sinanaerobacter chloroacetimidivorans]